MKKGIKSSILVATAAIGASAVAQPSRVAWTRSNLSTDISMDIIRDGKLTDNEFMCVAGASKQPNGTLKGNITILKPNRAVHDFVEVSPPGGGSLQFHKVIQHGGFYYAIGQAIPTGSQDGQIYIGKFDSNLNLVAEKMQAATTAGGFEEPTDVAVDPNGRIYFCGVAQKGTRHQSFLGFTDIMISSISFNYEQLEFGRYNRPQIVTNGIIAILIGLLTDSGPSVQAYAPTGPLKWVWGSNQTGSFVGTTILMDDIFGGHAFFGYGGTEEPNPGVFRSYGRVSKIDVSSGMEVDFFETPYVEGTAITSPRDAASGLPAMKRINFLFDQGPRARVYSFNQDLDVTGDWISPMNSVFSGGLAIDPYGEICGALCNNEVVTGFKLNAGNVLRFSWGTSLMALLLPYMEQDNLYNFKSGDIFNWRSDLNGFQVVCVQQAPIAVTDMYQPKTGRLFRPDQPVTINDRYAVGAAITITQQPMHGTVTMGSTGYFNYIPAPGYVGTDSFKYTLTKAGLNTSTATVNLLVKP